MIAVRLSAQCTDARVNLVTPGLFEKYPTLKSFADADISELEDIIRPCGFFRTKAKSIKEMAQQLIERHNGELPDNMEQLTALSGIGRKTANLIMGDVFGKPAIVTDTHFIRITGRLGLTASKEPHKVEKDLIPLIPPEKSSDFCHRTVQFGRDVCRARNPKCSGCPLNFICVYGKSVAEALHRKYVRVSLGGLHDEAEIRGHRRTYIGAMSGRIIQNLQKAGTSNPVFILDEIDKVTNDFKGDPASALLEVLDPEQNNAFHDNYLDIDYDLSKVMFIATANNLNTISQPLLDRMELIEVSGYIMEEKVEIAARHLVPKQLEIHGLPKGKVKFPKKTLQAIIESYTRESGVRELDKKIAKIMRKLARKLASDEVLPAQIRPEDLHDYLGAVEYTRDKYQGNDYAGVVTGLAWTAVGGEILFVESSLSKGKGSKLTLTGNLGDVMKESAMLALEYIHSHAGLFGIDEGMFENWNVHIHVPEGAIPKDGPSAGITMVTSLVSAFTQRKVRSNLAMTGEITLRGKVLPVGGIKEKILAAKRAGIKELILCKENKKDIEEIKPDYLKGLTFHYVDDIRQVVDLALLKEKVANPLF